MPETVDDVLAQANSAFVDENFGSALALYSKAMSVAAPTAQVYSKRAAAYLKLGQAADALADAMKGLELEPNNPMMQYRKGIAFFELRKFSDARQSFSKATQLGIADAERWIVKCDSELECMSASAAQSKVSDHIAKQITSTTTATTNPDDRSEIQAPSVVLTLAQKVRDTFYDNRSYITYTIYAKNIKGEDVKVDFINKRSVHIQLRFQDESIFERRMTLFSSIIPLECRTHHNPYKISLTMQKEIPGEQWERLEEAGPVQPEPTISNYPTSSKKKQNWGSLEKTVAEEEEKDQPEGDAALNKLFQQIYGNASDETKRAMIKSYQTSGGTVLSTNWNEVKDKNFEETVEAPAGMEVHRWNG